MPEEIIGQEAQETKEQEQHEEKTFTQAEVDAMIASRLSRERKNMPKADELEAFRNWQKEHAPKDDRTKMAEIESERDSAQTELEMSRRENYLLKQGIAADDVDFYVYKITKAMDDDETFEEAAKKYLKDHKHSTVKVDTQGRLNGGKGSTKTASETMNDLLRSSLKRQ